MKVALSFSGCHRRGGVERIVYECAAFLAGRQHEVHVFAAEWETIPKAAIQYHAVPVTTTPGFLRGPSYYRNCTRVLREFEYDVLNTHGCVCPTGGVQWVQSLHAAWLQRARAFRPPFSAAWFKQRINPLHPILLKLEARHFRYRMYKKLIATTEDVRRDLHEFYGVPREDVIIVPNGFSPTEFSPLRRCEQRETMRQRLGLKPDQVVLLFVGNELERKGYPAILSALRILNRKEIRLLVVGRPPINGVKKMAAAAGVADQVIACGPSSNVADYHAAADLFVLPTQYEAFCLAILEALGSGLPVITSRVPGAYDAIQEGINGLLVNDPSNGEELAAAIGHLLDEQRRGKFTADAPGSVARYQWPVVLGEYERILINHAGKS